MMVECTCGGKRAKADDQILLTKDHGPSLNTIMLQLTAQDQLSPTKVQIISRQSPGLPNHQISI